MNAPLAATVLAQFSHLPAARPAGGCGGGSGAPNNPFAPGPPVIGPLFVLPPAATVYAHTPATLTVSGGAPPYSAFSSNTADSSRRTGCRLGHDRAPAGRRRRRYSRDHHGAGFDRADRDIDRDRPAGADVQHADCRSRPQPRAARTRSAPATRRPRRCRCWARQGAPIPNRQVKFDVVDWRLRHSEQQSRPAAGCER